jgi:hypothetical protein
LVIPVTIIWVVIQIIRVESKPTLGPAKRLTNIKTKSVQMILIIPIEKNTASLISIKEKIFVIAIKMCMMGYNTYFSLISKGGTKPVVEIRLAMFI